MDIAAFAPVSTPIREAYVRDGVFIDAFVYPEFVLDELAEEHLRFRGSKILLQRAGTADAFLARLDQKHAAGPEPLADDERDARRVWVGKMLVRTSRGDAEGDYRRAWLLTSLLEDYFLLRGLWFQGPKKALIWLRENDPTTADAMEVAFKPGAGIDAIKKAAERALDGELFDPATLRRCDRGAAGWLSPSDLAIGWHIHTHRRQPVPVFALFYHQYAYQ